MTTVDHQWKKKKDKKKKTKSKRTRQKNKRVEKKENQMTAMRFQTGGGCPSSLAFIQGSFHWRCRELLNRGMGFTKPVIDCSKLSICEMT